MNVLHYGLILNQPYEITRGLRDIGVRADYALWDDCEQGWLIRGWDINLHMQSLSRSERHDKFNRFVSDVLENYDVIHFHSHPTLWYTNFLFSDYKDTEILKSHGKKLFVSFWGCEARRWKRDSKWSWSPCRNCGLYRRVYCGTCSNKVIAAARKYCNAIFSTGDICVENTDIQWSNLAINTRELDPSKLPSNETTGDEFVIYHSFGNSAKRPDVKGIKYIDRVIEKLKKDGYPIRYIFADNIPNEDLKYIQIKADIVIDQLCAGWYGTTAVECMSLAKPVISYLREDNLSICPNENVPVINATPITLEQTLICLMEDPGLLKEIGKNSRDYAIKYHDNRVVAADLLKYYRGKI